MYYMYRIYTCIIHVVLHMYYMYNYKIYTCNYIYVKMCITAFTLFTGDLFMYYRCMNYICNTSKTLHICHIKHYTSCLQHLFREWDLLVSTYLFSYVMDLTSCCSPIGANHQLKLFTISSVKLAQLKNKYPQMIGGPMVGILADQHSPKWRSTGNIWNLAYWISDSLLYWDISHTHLSYEQV